MSNIAEAKPEKITFIIDISSNIDKNFFLVMKDNETSYLTLIDGIINEIKSFVRLKGYISSTNIVFSLFVFTNKLNLLINFTEASLFLEFVKEKQIVSNENKDIIKDLSSVFTTVENNSFNSLNNEFNLNNRIIMFYTSDVPIEIDESIIKKIKKSFNFFFDIVYFHNKIKKDSNLKEIENIKNIYNSLNSFKLAKWYSFENSGNLTQFQHYMFLLISSCNQRVNYSELQKTQQLIDQMFINF